ncbi:hypothetical protein LguiA_031387 [Lonicera macranthoides]
MAMSLSWDLQNSLINMYYRCGVLSDGLKVFDKMPDRNLVSWTLVISGANQNSEFELGLKTFVDMTRTGLLPNEFALASVMKACTSIMADELGALDFGRQIHGLIVKVGVEPSTSVMNSLMDMYFKNIENDSALNTFNAMQDKDVVSWNTIFAGSSQDVDAREIVDLFLNLTLTGLKPTNFTFSILFRFCAEVQELDLGLQFYHLAFHFGFHDEASVSNSLVSMFSTCGTTDFARTVFDSVPFKITNNWNEKISAYRLSCDLEALKLFSNLWTLEMLMQNVGTSKVQRWLLTSHLNMLMLFNTMIMAYARQGLVKEAMEFFERMKSANLKPSQATFMSDPLVAIRVLLIWVVLYLNQLP